MNNAIWVVGLEFLVESADGNQLILNSLVAGFGCSPRGKE